MKKPYIVPEIEEISYCLDDVLRGDVIQDSQFEEYGDDRRWSFELEDDDESIFDDGF